MLPLKLMPMLAREHIWFQINGGAESLQVHSQCREQQPEVEDSGDVGSRMSSRPGVLVWGGAEDNGDLEMQTIWVQVWGDYLIISESDILIMSLSQ